MMLVLSFCLNFSYLGVILLSTSLLGQTYSVDNSTCVENYAFCVAYCSLSLSDYIALIVASCGDLFGVHCLCPMPCKSARVTTSFTRVRANSYLHGPQIPETDGTIAELNILE